MRPQRVAESHGYGIRDDLAYVNQTNIEDASLRPQRLTEGHHYGIPDNMAYVHQNSYEGAYMSSKPVNVKIPSFTGKVDWSTWIARFEALAYRYRWGREEKLDQLLPRIESQASEFVFTQLHSSVLQNYEDLIAELSSRYRKIETAGSFAVKFSNRVQKQGEPVEENAADLKALYEMAHRYR
ncbi:uncharacterized protein LOC128558432 [Mercenaria mercenaria]|uniref:uncharacterized protein LOC128558432 n=1 Tax=Mercenaria mercenaria TaxID=6596 RepID=UPI00234EAD8C|nr:uncharacterized protein LOC128558432 [Mercenaria mercenaria]